MKFTMLLLLPLIPFVMGFAWNAMAEAESSPAPLPMDSLRFFGRWDLRTPNHAITINSGSYVLAQFSGSSLTAHFDISLNKSPFPTISWKIDNGDWQEAEIWSQRKLAEGLADGPHTVWLMVRGMDEHQNRWKAPLVASVHFLGFTLAGNGKILPPLPQWDQPKLKMEFLGDSITEGVLVQDIRDSKHTWPWQTDALDSYACRTAIQLGAAWRQVGFGATGLAHGGSGGAPGALDSFAFFHASCPRDEWQPDVVVINQGTNDGSMAAEQYQPLYAKYLGLIRAAYPQAKIVALRPFNGAQAASIQKSVEQAHAAGDNAVFFIDTTGWYAGAVHPSSKSSEGLAKKLADAITTQVLSK